MKQGIARVLMIWVSLVASDAQGDVEGHAAPHVLAHFSAAGGDARLEAWSMGGPASVGFDFELSQDALVTRLVITDPDGSVGLELTDLDSPPLMWIPEPGSRVLLEMSLGLEVEDDLEISWIGSLVEGNVQTLSVGGVGGASIGMRVAAPQDPGDGPIKPTIFIQPILRCGAQLMRDLAPPHLSHAGLVLGGDWQLVLVHSSGSGDPIGIGFSDGGVLVPIELTGEDEDGDLIPDAYDACPTRPGPILTTDCLNWGCPSPVM